LLTVHPLYLLCVAHRSSSVFALCCSSFILCICSVLLTIHPLYLLCVVHRSSSVFAVLLIVHPLYLLCVAHRSSSVFVHVDYTLSLSSFVFSPLQFFFNLLTIFYHFLVYSAFLSEISMSFIVHIRSHKILLVHSNHFFDHDIFFSQNTPFSLFFLEKFCFIFNLNWGFHIY
jgi:hypothetical protein